MKCLEMRARFFVAYFESTMMTQPDECSFDDVSKYAQATAVLRRVSQSLHLRLDAARSRSFQIGGRTVSMIALKNLRARTRAAMRAGARRNLVQQSHGRDRVVNVGGRNFDCQRQARRIYNEVAFAAILPSISGVGSSVVPPKTARTDWLSMTARERSIWSSLPNARSRCRWTSDHTPIFVQSRSRRQQLTPLPQPNSAGSMFQAAPVRRMYRMPTSAERLGMLGRPPFGLGGSTGSRGSIAFHSSSGRSKNAT